MSLLSPRIYSSVLSRAIVRGGVVFTLIAHLCALQLGGLDASSTPISQLSRGDAGWIHSLGLLSLATVWAWLFWPLWIIDARPLWRLACVLLLLSVPILLYVAFYFASASDAQLLGEDANDPLSVLASALGVSMGALQTGLGRLKPRLARANLAILILWLGMIPVIPFIETGWLGAYERTVGVLMLAWTLLLTFVPRNAPRG